MTTLGRPLIVGLGGATCSGKSSTAKATLQFLTNSGVKALLLQQDNFYRDTMEELYIDELDYWNFDSIEAVDFEQLVVEVKTIEKTEKPVVILVEGSMIFEHQPLDELFDQRFFFSISFERCSRRRQRRVYEPPDVQGYFEKVVWPYYQSCRAKAFSRSDQFEWINGDQCLDEIYAQVGSSIIKRVDRNWTMLTKDKLNTQQVIDYVRDVLDGAIFSFAGTVRQNIQPPKVAYLRYEAYERMAMKQLREVCTEIRRVWPSVDRIAVVHRLGDVHVGETSVIIAVSSPHRAEAISAVGYCIEAIKKQVPIWKKEVYDDGTSEWRANEFSPTAAAHAQPNDGSKIHSSTNGSKRENNDVPISNQGKHAKFHE